MKIPTLVNLLNLISVKYFENFSCVIYINNAIGLDLQIPLPFIAANHSNLQDVLDRFKCEGFLIIGGNVRDNFISIEAQLREVKWIRYTERKYVLFSQDSVDVKGFFKHTFFNYVFNIVLIVEDPTGVIMNTTLFNQSKKYCFKFWKHAYFGTLINEAVLLRNWCENEEFDLLTVFPKIKDAKGKILEVSTFNFMPYVNLDTHRGVELLMVQSFANSYNFTMKLTLEKAMWGMVSGNFTGEGAYYKAAIGEADIALGGYYTMERKYFYCQSSIPTINNALTFLVPVPLPERGFSSPLRPFSLIGWLLIILIFLTMCGFNLLLQYTYIRLKIMQENEKVDDDLPFFNIYGIVLQQSVSIKFRILGTFSLLFGIIFAAFYSSGISSSMTKHIYKNQIKTGEQLEATTIDIVGYDESYISGIKLDHRYTSLVNRFTTMKEIELQKYITKNTQFALAIDHMDLGYSLGEYEKVLTVRDLEKFKLLKEDLSYETCILIGYKHSVIFPLLDEHLYKLKESGLDYYWLALSFRDMDYKIQLYLISPDEMKSTLQLKWRNVEGVFGFWSIGLLISFLVFLYEMYKFRRVNYNQN